MSAATSLEGPLGGSTVRTTVLVRLVDFVCPRCGDEREGTHVAAEDGTAHVECGSCRHELDVDVLRIPTRARLATWRDDAALHGDTALRCADGIHGCSYLALASCRRLAPEMTPVGKVRLLGELAGAVAGELTAAQRSVLVELGAALGLQARTINGLLAVL